MPKGVYERTEEHKRKFREHQIGRKRTDESKKKMSEAKKGKNHPMYGRKHTDEAKKKIREGNTIHGMKGTPEYAGWMCMKAKCYYIKHGSYKSHGARGIKVCDRWKNSFQNFYEDMGPRPKPRGVSVTRINIDKDFEPENCRWQ